MSVPAAYATVIILWSTTPLAIVWSVESVHPTLALLSRMALGTIVGWFLICALRVHFPWCKQAKKVYALSAYGIVTGMSLGYVAAQYISSGLMSLIFGLSPLVSAYLGWALLGDAKLTKLQKASMGLALLGLFIVCYEKIELQPDSWIGIVLVLMSVVFFSSSGVLIKRVNLDIHPLSTTVGALTFSTPIFVLVWLIFDGNFELSQWSDKSLFSILYLAVFGSIIGFLAYFHILNHLAMTTVALATLVTPPIAITIGALLNNETLNLTLFVGMSIILFALFSFQFGEKYLLKVMQKRAA